MCISQGFLLICCFTSGITVTLRAANGLFFIQLSRRSLFKQALYQTPHPSRCLESSTADWGQLFTGVSSSSTTVGRHSTVSSLYTHRDLPLPNKQFELCFNLLISPLCRVKMTLKEACLVWCFVVVVRVSFPVISL